MAELERFRLEEISNDQWVSAAGEKVREALESDPNGRWAKLQLPLLGEKARAAIDEQLAQIEPMELFAQVWSKAREIRALPPDRTSIVELGKHDLRQDLHPLVTVTFGAWESAPIRFTLALCAKIQAVELEIRNRRIIAAGGGKCGLSAELKYEDHSLSGPAEIRTYDLPGTYRFKGEGIPIGSGATAADDGPG